MHNLTIFDADFLLFTATMGNKCLDDEGNPIKIDNKFTYTQKTEEEVYQCADQIIELILAKTQAHYYVGYLGGCKSFRYNIYSDYKANRKDLVRPAYFDELKQYLIDKWKFIKTENGLEADDAVNIVRNNLKNDFNCLIVSSDKDLIKSIPGVYMNARNLEIVVTSDKEAHEFFWKSMVTGDVTDNIKGLPGKGEVSATKIIQLADEMHTSYPMEILDKYIRQFGLLVGIEEYYKNFKCLHILDNFSNFVIPDLVAYNSYIIDDLEELNLEGI